MMRLLRAYPPNLRLLKVAGFERPLTADGLTSSAGGIGSGWEKYPVSGALAASTKWTEHIRRIP